MPRKGALFWPKKPYTAPTLNATFALSPSQASRQHLVQGFAAVFPLWLGILPFAVAYAVTARASGVSAFDTCLMSLTVFGGASQFAVAAMVGQGASTASLVLTTFLLNTRHLLYGLSLSRQFSMAPAERVTAAQFLTDEAYALTTLAAQHEPEKAGFAFLLGTGLSVYTVWNLGTLLGVLAGGVLPSPQALGAGVIFPLAFLGLLMPMLGDRLSTAVAVLSGLLAWGLSQVLPGGLVVLLTGVGGALLGAYWYTRRAARGNRPQPENHPEPENNEAGA